MKFSFKPPISKSNQENFDSFYSSKKEQEKFSTLLEKQNWKKTSCKEIPYFKFSFKFPISKSNQENLYSFYSSKKEQEKFSTLFEKAKWKKTSCKEIPYFKFLCS
jgi:hypothetical protein